MADFNVPQTSKTNSEEDAEEVFSDEMTMVDFLKEEERIEENVMAVLGGSDDRNCTYIMGYLKRQALYSCLTCIPAKSKEEPAGICLACTFFCHDGHELVELYTKRNFRCDCGNKRFPKVDCNLNKNKENLNVLNKYNQNFVGKYCTCHRPYPDPDGDPEEMIQCVMCEDWYHTKHIGTETVPARYSEMICRGCVNKHGFVRHYEALCVKEGEEAETDKEVSETKEGHGKEKLTAAECPLTTVDKMEARTMFMSNKWRESLCRCTLCMALYEDQNLQYLLDPEDQVTAYETKGLMPNGKPATSQYEKGLEALATLDRSNVIQAVEGYNTMKDELKDYLKKFAENKKVVREEDIHEFFSTMQARKKARTNLPFFCR